MLLLPAFCYAELYHWTDKNGVKHFSNTPPHSDTVEIRQMDEFVGEDSAETDYLRQALDLYKPADHPKHSGPEKLRQRTPKVVMYTTPTCGYCHRAKAYFNQQGIRFTELDVTKSQKARKAFKALNGRGVPLIVIGDQRIAGFNRAAIDRALGLP